MLQLVTINEGEGLPDGLVLQDFSFQSDGFRAYLRGENVQLVPWRPVLPGAPPWGAADVARHAPVRHSGRVITVLLRYDHHVDHTFLEATHYRDDDSVLTVYVGEQEVARFPAGSWDGVYRHESTQVREKDGRVRPAQRLEVRVTAAD